MMSYSSINIGVNNDTYTACILSGRTRLSVEQLFSLEAFSQGLREKLTLDEFVQLIERLLFSVVYDVWIELS